MDKLNYIELSKKNKEELIRFLISNEWPFHVNQKITEEKCREYLREGTFTSNSSKTFLVYGNESNILGMIRLFDLDDIEDGEGSPLFDIRIAEKFRGKGNGEKMVSWLTSYLFQNYEKLNRIEATTRVDNFSMRKVLVKNYYVKEGHYRESWPDQNGIFVDTVRYAVLKNDWRNKICTSVNWNDF